MNAFQQAFAILIGEEGGYGADTRDPGNWTGGRVGAGTCRGTKFGISAASYPALDIAGLTLDAAQAIYRRDYWDKVRGDELPPPLALLVFDAAVNNGAGQARLWLQAALGGKADGQLGEKTMAAVWAAKAQEIQVKFQAARLLTMASLSTWPTFGRGWARRLCRLPYMAATMAN